MEPRIVALGALKLVGLPFYGAPQGNVFGSTWQRLFQMNLSVEKRVDPRVNYGLEVYGPEFHQEGKWTYFPCFEVRDLDEIPGELFAKILPAATYAVFSVRGGLDKISEAFQFAYSQWLPLSPYEVAHPYDIERYGENYKGDVPESELEIYIPIRPKPVTGRG